MSIESKSSSGSRVRNRWLMVTGGVLSVGLTVIYLAVDRTSLYWAHREWWGEVIRWILG